jgi:hypothetical protein
MQLALGRAGSRWLVGVLCTLTAGCLFAPASARAACGEYVTIGGRTAMTGHPTSPELFRPMSGPLDGHKPCTGPGCSGGPPSAPLVPVIPAVPPQVEDTGLVAAAHAAEFDPRPAGRWDDVTRLRPIRVSPSVYHPPR